MKPPPYKQATAPVEAWLHERVRAERDDLQAEVERLAEQRCIAHAAYETKHGDCSICDLEQAEARVEQLEKELEDQGVPTGLPAITGISWLAAKREEAEARVEQLEAEAVQLRALAGEAAAMKTQAIKRVEDLEQVLRDAVSTVQHGRVGQVGRSLIYSVQVDKRAVDRWKVALNPTTGEQQ